MMIKTRHIILSLMAAALVYPASSAMAAQSPKKDALPAPFGMSAQFDSNRPARTSPLIQRYAQQRRISASRAKSAAMSRYRGAKFINVQLSGNVYRVRLQQKNGRIIDVYVDARTGRVRG